ncbi:MAG: hypothetical protein R3297_03390 [Desulfobulbales bacterium]|nr:hypothetical protein [Desulfobulbales bacterium]
MSNSEIIISEEERDILQEVMNIAFGKASADLADIIDVYVVLSIPHIKLMKTGEVAGYIEAEIDNLENISVIKQSYSGKFHGTALLLFPDGAGKKLFSLFDNGGEGPGESEEISFGLEKETLLEVGNILIGASVSKVADLLDDVVSYRPPRIIIESRPGDIVDWDLAEPDAPAILMHTVFGFENRDISGLLFLLPSYKSLAWLKKALHAFLEQYV